MRDQPTCPHCGTPLPPDAPSGVCPQCLLQAALSPTEADSTLVPGTMPRLDTPTLPAGAPQVGEKVRYFGDYELLEEIARGGMGVVYKARQVRLNRVVALKMILAGQFASEADVRRFHTEAEAAAQLDHPGIVPIFEVGQHEGHHYFSMGFVEGESLAARLTAGPLPPREAAGVVRKVALAVQFAHDAGVIHRDLKPANVLLQQRPTTDHTGEVDNRKTHCSSSVPPAPSVADCVPKVTDFGLAKRVQGESNLTATGEVLGTPSFMSPEQAAGRPDQISFATDVYALGAILYATLTGRPPFDASNPLDTLLQVIGRDPVTPRELNPSIPRDLETVCLKCLEKDRRRRYPTARELAEELQRFLDGVPVRARRISPLTRAWRWCRRHPAATAALVAVTALFLTTAAGAVWVNAERAEALRQRGIAVQERENADAERIRADQQRNLARDENLRAQQNLVASQLLLGKIARDNSDTAEALSWYLQAYLHSAPEDPTRTSARNLIGAWAGSLKQTLVHDGGIHQVAVSPDGRLLIAGYFHSRTQLWDLAVGRPLGPPQPHAGDVVSVALSPDGRSALTGDWEGAKVWDTATGQLRFPMLAHAVREDTVVGPVLSPDGRTIATRSPFEAVRLWDAETGKPRGEPLAHGEMIWEMIFSPDGKRLASLGGSVARLWDVETGKPLGAPFKESNDLAFHPESRLVAVCRKDGKVLLHEIDTGRQVAELTHEGSLRTVQFDPKGRHLLAADGEKAHLWLNAVGAERARRVLPHGRNLLTASFGPDGTTVLTASPTLLRAWSIRGEQPAWERNSLAAPGQERGAQLKSAVFSPDGRSVLVRTENGTANVFAAGTGKLLLREQNVLQAAFTPDGKTLLAGSRDGWVRVRAVEASDPRRLPAVRVPPGVGRVQKVSFSPDGRLAVLAGEAGARLCRADTWEPVGDPLAHPGPIGAAAFSPDGRTLITSASGKREGLFGPTPGQLLLWDVATRQQIGGPIAVKHAAYSLAFDASGETVLGNQWLCHVKTSEVRDLEPRAARADQWAVGQLVGRLESPVPRLWDDEKGEPTRVPLPVGDVVQAVLTQDGCRLLTVQKDGGARLWDVESGRPLGPRFQPEGMPRERTADARYALFGTMTTLRIWDPLTGRPCGEPLQNEMANAYASFSPSGSMLATRWHFTANLWDSATGQALAPPLPLPTNGGAEPFFSPDGRRLYVLCIGLECWRAPSPAADDPARLQLSVEVRTGMGVDGNGALRKLSQAQWLERKARLEKLGGPCDVTE